MSAFKEKGFAHLPLFVGVIVILVIGAIGWRVINATHEGKKNAQLQTQQNDQNKSIDKLSSEEQAKLKAEDGDLPPTAETTPTVATTQKTPTKPVNNSTTGTVSQPQQQPAPTPSTPSSPAAPEVLRPTTAFCAEKKGESFTNVWFTGTGTYTYDGYAWENGYTYTLPRVSKTETGTPLRSYDTNLIFDVVEYGTQPLWARCSDKPGYVTVYYTVPQSPYTFNVLAEFGHLSLQQP